MIRLAIDASNLPHDRRGMGRLARPVVRMARADPAFDVTLIADRRDDADALRAEFPGVAVGGRDRGSYDVAWFPFNGIRHRVAAAAVVSIADAFAFTQPHRDLVARFREQAPIRRAARVAARVVTLSTWSRDEIVRELAVEPERIVVIAPEPDPFWSPGDAGALPDGIAGRRFALLVGAREPRKNARLALEACARALHGPDELLVIVGALGTEDRAYARLRGLACGEIAASDDVLRTLYRGAAAVLVPSFAEGFGLVAAEALACGAPVLAADAAALPEATGGAARLLDPRDPDLWAREIRRLLDDPAEAVAARGLGIARYAATDRAEPTRRLLAVLRDVALAAARP